MKKLTQKFSQWLLTAFLLAGLQFNSNAQTATHLNFDGANDYVDCGSILPASYTKEAWIRISNLGAINNIISGGASDGSHAFWAHTGYGNRLSAGHNLVWDQVQDPTPLLANIWYHVAVTYDAATTTMRLYKNGTLVSTNTSVPPFTIGNKVRLGAYGDATYLFQGDMDEVRIWNFARSQAAISASMNSELVGNESGLTAYYKFNQGIAAGNNTAITTLTNATANPFNGSIINFALTGATSNFLDGSPALPPTPATHLHFDGTNDFVRCGTAFNAAFSSRNTVTLEAWVRSETTTGSGVVAGNFSGADNNIYLQFLIRRDGAHYVFWILNSTNTAYVNVTAANAVAVNTWQHVVGVRNGDQLLIYINGVLVNTTAGVGTHNFTANTGNEFTIGGNARPFLEFFRGDIDEVRVWTTALSATEIARRRNCELQGNEVELYAYYKFNQGDAAGTNTAVTTLTNSSATVGLNGTLTNMTLTGTTSNWVGSSPVITGSTLPSAPSAAAQSFCGTGTVANLVPAPSATINWYNVATGGTALAGTTALATGTYYVAAVNANGCESGRTSVTITINALPSPPIASAQSFCGSATVANLSPAPSATIKWYNVLTGGAELAGSTALATGSYYVAEVNAGGCESARTVVSVTITSMPDINYAGVPATFCIGIPIIPLSVVNTGGAGTNSDGYTVSTFAGSGVGGFVNGTGTAAQFNYPAGVATDAIGNIYVADAANNSIRKITPAGVVITFAGSSVAGFADGTGTAAQFDSPYGVATDAAGNVYVADQGNHSIRKITPAGVVTTLAGSGVAGFADGTGTAAQFNYPLGVAIDAAGYIYVADQTNHSIRKITAAGVVTTLAGNGVAGFADGTGTTAMFNYPVGITTDAASNIYVSDMGNERIRKITPAGVVSTFAGNGVSGFADGAGTTAQFSGPFGLTTDTAGNVYVADYSNRRIRKITASGFVTTLAGNGVTGYADGPGLMAEFSNPNGLAIDAAGNLYVGDQSNHRIRKIVNNPYNITPYLPTGLSFDSNTGEISGTPSVVTANTIYTITTGNNCGNNSTTINFAVGSSPLIAMANTTLTLAVTGTTSFNNNCTDLIATVTSNGSSPIFGSTTAKVWIEGTQNPQFVKRHYEITPALNTATATGIITLYFTQAEFDDFNTISAVDLPTGSADATGKANLLIEKRSGVSTDGSGFPSTYTGSVITIDPVDTDIVWNVTANRWEVSFDVTGFSGFFVKTQAAALPVSLINFTATKQVNDNVLLQWLTANEINFNRFELQRSTNGSSFENIGMVTARNTGGNNNYQLNDNTVWTSDVRYYRLKMIDNDGTYKYSTVVRISNKENNSSLSVYPNPVTDVFTLQVADNKLLYTTAQLVDVSGKLIKLISIKNPFQTVHIGSVPKGIYLLKLEDGSVIKIIKE